MGSPPPSSLHLLRIFLLSYLHVRQSNRMWCVSIRARMVHSQHLSVSAIPMLLREVSMTAYPNFSWNYNLETYTASFIAAVSGPWLSSTGHTVLSPAGASVVPCPKPIISLLPLSFRDQASNMGKQPKHFWVSLYAHPLCHFLVYLISSLISLDAYVS